MPIPDWIVSVLALTIIVVPTLYIIFVVNSLSELWFAKKIQSRINKAIVSIFETYSKNREYEPCCYELDLILKKLATRSPLLHKRYESIISIMDHFLLDFEQGKVPCNIDKEILKKAIFDFIKIYQNNNPLDQMKGAHYSLLKELINEETSEKQLNLINQLAIELKIRDETILGLQLKNRTSNTLSAIGIILTVVFGIIALFK